MISKFPGICAICKKPTRAGQDHYDVEQKTSYHASCQQDVEDHPQLSLEYLALAERLGYRPHADWTLLLLSSTDLRGSAGRPESETRGRNTIFKVPSGDTVANIAENRGAESDG